jgi:hypothetical protein
MASELSNTIRLIEQSQVHSDLTHPVFNRSATNTGYLITPCGTEPESWVLERVRDNGNETEQLILFDSWAEASGVLNLFG